MAMSRIRTSCRYTKSGIFLNAGLLHFKHSLVMNQMQKPGIQGRCRASGVVCAAKKRGGNFRKRYPPRVTVPEKMGVTRCEDRDVLPGGLLAMPNLAAHLSLLSTDFPPTFASLLDAHLPTHSCGSLNGTQCDSNRRIEHGNVKPWKNQEPITVSILASTFTPDGVWGYSSPRPAD